MVPPGLLELWAVCMRGLREDTSILSLEWLRFSLFLLLVLFLGQGVLLCGTPGAVLLGLRAI